jgi:hypothetical protein
MIASAPLTAAKASGIDLTRRNVRGRITHRLNQDGE